MLLHLAAIAKSPELVGCSNPLILPALEGILIQMDTYPQERPGLPLLTARIMEVDPATERITSASDRFHFGRTLQAF